MSATLPDPASAPPTSRTIRNAALLAVCEAIGVYFFFLHLRTWWLASAALGVVTATIGVLIKWTSYAKVWLAPAARWVLDWEATTPILAVAAVAMIALLLTTVSVNVRLIDGASAKISVAWPRWRTSDTLSVDSDRKDASRRYFFRFAPADVVVAPVGDGVHASFTEHCVAPGTALEVRIPYSLPERFSICLLPATGMRLPLPTDNAASRFSGFLLIAGKKYPFRNWKVGALCFGGNGFDRQSDAATAGKIDLVAKVYFDSHGVETSPDDRAEYITFWKKNLTSIITPDLMPREVIFVEIDEGDGPFLRQVIEVGTDRTKILFVEQQHEPAIVDELGK
jgi:hypothetical protein